MALKADAPANALKKLRLVAMRRASLAVPGSRFDLTQSRDRGAKQALTPDARGEPVLNRRHANIPRHQSAGSQMAGDELAVSILPAKGKGAVRKTAIGVT